MKQLPWFIVTPARLRQSATILLGAAIAAYGLEAFLLPNHLLDGGVVGVSIISAALSHEPFSVFLVLYNLPFILLGYRKMGRGFAAAATLGIVTLALLTAFVHLPHSATQQPMLAAVFGGVFVGLGVGTVVKAGGTLDGTEVLAILADRRLPFSIGEIILFFNLFILGGAGLVFGWDNAFYSLIAYFVAYKTIDVTVTGLAESRSAFIVSLEHQAIGSDLRSELGHDVTYLQGRDTFGLVPHQIIFTVITRMEEQKLKAIVYRHDRKAFIAVGPVHEVVGGSH